MTDVRLTATNPEDSSVVPVACNTRGELLIEEVKIEEIDNDLTVNGGLEIKIGETEPYRVDWRFQNEVETFGAWNVEHEYYAHDFRTSGHCIHKRYVEPNVFRNVQITLNSAAIRVFDEGIAQWSVGWDGAVTSNSLLISLEPDNPIHYSSVRNAETGEETKEYIGPVVNVGEELEFLRAQVRILMEKLKMTPEGGWEVWDGSTET